MLRQVADDIDKPAKSCHAQVDRWSRKYVKKVGIPLMTGKSYNHWPSLMLLLLIFGCGIPERPKIITISKAPVFRPSNPEEVQTVDQAMAAIITVCRENLGLPVVDPLYVYLYKNTASFAFYGHGWTTLPFDVANKAAFAQDHKIKVNLEKTPKESGGLVRFLAHEYAHNIHYTIAGKEPLTARWVTEGFADWVAARVLHFLKWQDYGITLHRARQELIRHRDILPEISSLFYNSDWDRLLSQSKGLVRTLSLAFVAVDELIQQKGFSATIQYLGSADFEGSFGLSRRDLEVDLGKYLLEMKRPKQIAFTVGKPDWRIGYRWVYAEKRPGSSTTLVKEVIREDTFQGVPSFVVRGKERDNFYAKGTLGLVATMKDGKLISALDKPEQLFSWPLEAGKEWRNSFTRRNLEQKSSGKSDRSMLVAGVEEIKVPAGTFEAIKIEAYGFTTGRLREEYWYSPKAKWFIKIRTYLDEGLIEEELVSFESGEKGSGGLK